MAVRRAGSHDLDALAALDRACFPADQCWSRQAWEEELAGADRTVLVARVSSGDPSTEELATSSALLGAVSVGRQFETVDLLRVMVHPAQRRQRLAERLVQEAVWYVRDAERVLLEVRHDNAAALMLYARLGFRVIDRRDHYYGPGRHAVVMQSDLPWEAHS